MALKTFQSGEVIFRQGEIGESFFQIVDGSVEVWLGYGEEDALKLTELKKDQFLGEMAVIERYPRSATAVAGADGAEVEEIPSGEVNAYLDSNPEHIGQLINHLGARLKELTGDYQEVSSVINEIRENKSEKTFMDKIRKFAKVRKPGNKNADAPSAEVLRQTEELSHSAGFAKKIVEYPKGTVICREGERGDCIYDIHAGKVGIYTGYGTDKETKLTELFANNFFGEMGMVSGEPRSATAVALENTTLEIIHPEDMNELFEKNPPKVNMILGHLSNRLRKLTNEYESACSVACELSEN